MTSDISYEEFKKIFADGHSQIIWQWVEADLETPVSTWLKLCSNAEHSILLESVEGGTVLGRYSAIAMEPDLFWRCKNGKAEKSSDFIKWKEEKNDPLTSLKNTISESKIEQVPSDLPPMSSSGLFGYMGYDMIRLIENIPDNNPDPLEIPDAILMRPKVVLIFDNIKHMLCISIPVREHCNNQSETAETVFNNAIKRINKIKKTLVSGKIDELEGPNNQPNELNIQSNTSKEEYFEMVRKAKDYIHEGEIFQVVPSQRFSMNYNLSPFELYRSLRRLNPSPFLFHLKLGDISLIGSSPEILVRVRDGKVSIRPIAGTRKRGETEEEDKNLANELLNDPKERAEHLMLLDLARNDIGKIAEIGSLNITDKFFIEYYSHVMHIVSNVEGKLSKNTHPIDALFSGFPAGTVSGAPKIRAMEIIDELEKEKRSFYAGCIGYFDGHGDVDTCITLRTALIKNNKLHVQAGGGVVADSDPEFEYQESCNKAKAILAAAEQSFEMAASRYHKNTSSD
jgi:anthranilate synthase component 1